MVVGQRRISRIIADHQVGQIAIQARNVPRTIGSTPRFSHQQTRTLFKDPQTGLIGQTIQRDAIIRRIAELTIPTEERITLKPMSTIAKR